MTTRTFFTWLRRSALSVALLGAAVASVAQAQNTVFLKAQTDTITPSFRDANNTDANNTTFFGWAPGSYDATAGNPADNDERVTNPPVNLGVGGLDGSITQVDPTKDFLASSNNIYVPAPPAAFDLTIPVNVPAESVGTGYVTIFIQGRGSSGAYPANPISFGDLDGATKSVYVTPINGATGGGATGATGQFLAVYVVPAPEAAQYVVRMNLIAGNASVGFLRVDTQWTANEPVLDTYVPFIKASLPVNASQFSLTNNAGQPATDVEVTVTRSAEDAALGASDVTFTVTQEDNGPFSPGQDSFTTYTPAEYEVLTPTISFAPGATSAVGRVRLKSLSEESFPNTGTLEVAIGFPSGTNPGGVDPAANNEQVVTVVTGAPVYFTSQGATVTENPSTGIPVTYTVKRDSTAGTASVRVMVAPVGTTVNASDTAFTSQIVNFAAGEDAKQFEFFVRPDSLTEGDETLTLYLTELTGSVFPGPENQTFVLTIKDAASAQRFFTLGSPKNGARITAPNVTVAGTVAEPNGLDSVKVYLNGVLAGNATVTDGAYSLIVNPQPGVNTLIVQAVDTFENVIGTQVSTFTFTLNRPILGGAYSGLFYPNDDVALGTYTGLVSVNVTAAGGFSGSVKLAGATIPISGTIAPSGAAVFKGGQSSQPLVATVRRQSVVFGFLRFSVAPDGLTGTVNIDGQPTGNVTLASGSLARAIYTSRANPVAPLTNVPAEILNPARENGNYTLVIEPNVPSESPADLETPAGLGHATVIVLKTGLVKFNGKLPDGTPLIVTAPLLHGNVVALYLPAYSGLGAFGTSVAIDGDDNEIYGEGLWVKPDGLAKQTVYPNGWPLLFVEVNGSEYIAPSTRSGSLNTRSVLGPLAPLDATYTIAAEGGGLTPVEEELDATNQFTISAASKATILPNGDLTNLLLTFVPSTGAFSGSFTHPETNAKVSFSGVVLQREGAGGGQFLNKTANPATSSVGRILFPGLQ